jgi:sugar phosphate permease
LRARIGIQNSATKEETATYFLWLVDSCCGFWWTGRFWRLQSVWFKCDRVALSGAFSLKGLESGLLGPIDGFLVDRFGSKKMVLAGAFTAGLGFVLMSLIDSLIQFYGVLILIAAGMGLAFQVAMHTAIANWFRRKRGISIGIFQSGMVVAGLIVPLISLAIVRQGFRFAALTIGILVWIVSIPVALVIREKPEPFGLFPDGDSVKTQSSKGMLIEEEGFTVKEALATHVFWVLSIALALRFMVTVAMTTHLMPYFLDVGFDQATAAAGFGSVAAVSCLGRLGFGWLGDRFQKRYMLASLMGILILSLLFLTQVKNILQMAIFIGLYAPAYGGQSVLVHSIRAEYFGRRAYGSIMGYMNLVWYTGSFIGPIFAAWVWEKTGSYKTAFIIFAGTSLVSLVMTFLSKAPKRTTVQNLR